MTNLHKDIRKVLVTGGSGFIGTHFCECLLEKKISFLNFDKKPPLLERHQDYWVAGDILKQEEVVDLCREFQPTYVVHLAARASMEGTSIDDFPENTIGTKNVLETVQQTASVERVIITSSQHVRKPGSGLPYDDGVYHPHGLYGESKVITEQLTREADMDCTWAIARPTNVWGAYHPFLVDGLWRLMRMGLYVHPKDDSVIRSYGYVKNVVWQFLKILKVPACLIDKKTLYLGEPPMKQIDWINTFSMALNNRKVYTLSQSSIHLLAWIGDILGRVGISFPMYSERFFNLTTSNPVPTDETIDLFGHPPYSLDDGVKETVAWLEEYWK